MILLLVLTFTVVGGGVLRWLFGGDNEDYDEEDDDDSDTDGPFNMITETYYEDEDYELWLDIISLYVIFHGFIKT